ncbi:PIN domain-containing protein [Candidatus Woesearchaeota archaeon]|nr:PIN domain-containing protein [Candidatus Woesearchaeota archaeon]
MSDIYFFDTYAIIEIIKGNKNYEKFKDVRIIVTIFNLIELHYILLREFNKEIADIVLERYSNYVMGIDIDIIKSANEFKLVNKKKKLSVADSIGYTLALKKGIKFLTGDKEFKDIPNVEFVK